MTAFVLDRLLNGKESASFVVVEDTLNLSGWPILKEFVARAAADGISVILVCTEVEPRSFLSSVPSAQHVHVVDSYTNPLGWDDDLPALTSPNVHTVTNMKDFKRLASTIEGIAAKLPNKHLLLAFDSLAPLLALSAPKTYHLLRHLSALTSEIRLVVLYHTDIPLLTTSAVPLPNKTLNALASATVSVRAPGLEGDEFGYLCVRANGWSGVTEIVLRKKSGKVMMETSAYKIVEGRVVVVSFEEEKGKGRKGEAEEDVEEPDPTANLSFNLSLTSSQRQARENVVLPYLKVDESQISTAKTAGGGAIYYEPDAADDFDEEDPDEDLII